MDFTEKYLRGRDTAENIFTKRKLGRMGETGDSNGSKHGLPMFLSQDEGNRIKRKFLFLSVFSPSNSSSSLMGSPRYEVLEEKYRCAMGFLESMGDMAGLAKEELESKFPEWKDPMIPQFEELLIKSLSVSYRVAIKKIAMCGYSEEIAKCAILRSGPYFGSKDIVSSIVDGALVFLEGEKEFDTSKCRMFEDFDNLAEYTMLEMTCVLMEVKPSQSVVEAMMHLLILDLSLPLACALLFKSLADEDVQDKTSSDSTLDQQVNSEPQKSKPDLQMLGSQLLLKLQKREKESGRKINLRHSEKDLLRQKTFQLEKSSKAKLTNLGAHPLDKKPKPPEVNPKTPMPTQEKGKSTQKSTLMTAEYYCAGARIPYDESQGKYVAQDKKDEIILAAVSRLQALQKAVKGWNDWAYMTVEVAVSRLNTEQAELETLMLEKKVAEKFIKFSEEKTIPRLEEKNSVLKEKMEYAREKGLLEAAKLEKALLKEKEALNKSQSICPEKDLLQDELTALKSKRSALQKETEKSKVVINQFEVQRGQEEKKKMKLLKQGENIKKERERMETVANAEEKRTEENVKKELEKRKVKMTKIEEMMCGLKLKIEAEKKESLKQEHRCVCMAKENSVVFLPCAHQRLCVDCNEIFEKNGTKYCSFCVTLIQKRIKARFRTG